ncbi:MAG: HipA domain-containing protein [Lachnospiraceae bacterium]|nr:HipA domain-containing protein [Lachnospiraceae bacterium]
MNEYNFNAHITEKLFNRFGGSERKETVVLDDGNEYLLKLPDPVRELGRDLSYINNAFSEFLGCRIMRLLGIPVQDVILGEYTAKSSTGEERTYIACACKNLETDGYRLSEAELTSLSSADDTKGAQTPSFETIGEIAKYTPGISEQEIRKFYAEMFVADAFIGNTDRHNGNWGFLSKIGNERKLAPVYDCGSCLCPLVADELLSDRFADNEAMNGMSVIKDRNGSKISYRQYLYSCENEDVNRALAVIVPRIEMGEILKLIEATPYISDARKRFYSRFLVTKYQRVLVPALEKLHERNLSFAERTISGDELYASYKKTVRPLRDIPMFEKREIRICGRQLNAIRADEGSVILADPITKKSEAVISPRSNNAEAWRSLQILSQTFGAPVQKLVVEAERADEQPKGKDKPGKMAR